MNILTFSTLYPHAARLGHGIFVETRLRKLVASGQLHATVVAPVPWFPFRHSTFGEYACHARAPRAEVRNGIEVLHPRFPVLPKLGAPITPLLLARAVAPTLRGLLRRRRFDLIDAHYFFPDGVAAVMLGRRLGLPVVITARGTDINLHAQYPLSGRMIRWAARQASGVVAVSRALKQELVALGIHPDRVQVLRNGVDLDLFRPAEARDGLRQALGFRRRTLLSVGNLLDFKGHGIAIEALSILPDCDLVIIGNGPDGTSFERLARDRKVDDRVRFAGSLPQERLAQYYAAADAVVLASSREGWPNVLLEAMACGTPVIATDVGGVSEIVTAPEAGRIVETRTPHSIATAARTLLSAPPNRAATRRFAEQFGWGPTIHGQLQLFTDLIGLHSGLAPLRAAGASG